MKARPASLLKDLRALPRAFWILFAGTFINRFGTFVWPFLTIYLSRQGYTLGNVAWAISALGAGSLFGSIFGGWMADHVGRRHTIVLGSFGAASSVMLLYGSNNLPWIIVSTVLWGFAAGTYHPAASALLADIVPAEHRIRAYAAVRLAGNAGFAFGASAGGVLANYSIFWLFAGDALTTLIYCGIALMWLPHGLRRQTENAPWREAVSVLKRDRAFHLLWAALFFDALICAQFSSTYSLHVIRQNLSVEFWGHRLGPEMIFGLLLAWNGVLVTICELPLTAITLRYDARRVTAVGILLMGLGFGLNAWAHQIAGLIVAMTIFTLGEMLSSPTLSALVAQIAPERLRGRYMGTLALSGSAASITGPHIGFALFALDPRFVWSGCVALGVVSAGLILIRPPRVKIAVPPKSGAASPKRRDADHCVKT